MRSALLAALSAVLFAMSTPCARATPITYDLTLTPSAGSLYGGTGTLVLNASPSSTGVSTYTSTSGLENLTFSLDNQTFTLAGAGGNALVEFVNGSIYDITFSEAIGTSPYRFDLQTSSAYALYYNNDQSESSGTFTAVLAPSTSPVPEVSSVILLGTGMLIMAGFARSRFV